MGYSHGNKFWPDDTEDKMYTLNLSLHELIKQASKKWPGVDFHDLEIEAWNIQTDSIGYDLYCSSDYTNFIVISRK